MTDKIDAEEARSLTLKNIEYKSITERESIKDKIQDAIRKGNFSIVTCFKFEENAEYFINLGYDVSSYSSRDCPNNFSISWSPKEDESRNDVKTLFNWLWD